ncbi:MAG: hypothetical protein ACOX7K_04195 [Oscillospiraceae bacterium]
MKRFYTLLFSFLLLLTFITGCGTDKQSDTLSETVLTQEQRDYANTLGQTLENRLIVCRCDMGEYLLYATIPLTNGIVRPNSTTLYEFFSDCEAYEAAAVAAQSLSGNLLDSYSFNDDLMLITESERNLLGPISYEQARKTLTQNDAYTILE